MFDVNDLLDRAKAAAGVTSDYALALKVLRLKNTTNVTNWRSGRSAPDERAILKLCELTGDNPYYVASMIQSMRAANDDAASLWRRAAEQLKGGYVDFTLLVLLAMVSGAVFAVQAWGADSPLLMAMAGSAYYVKWIAALRLVWRAWRLCRRTAALSAGPALA